MTENAFIYIKILFFKIQILLCLLIVGTYSEPEIETEYESEIGQPTRYIPVGRVSSPSAKYKPTSSSSSQPRYPQPPISYFEQSQYKPSYEQVEYNYCDPRSPPHCVKNATEIFCLKDFEYPEKEVQVFSR